MEYDFVVIGTGGAGNGVALEAAQQGLKTAAIDKGPWGGTCARVGCVPKKVFARASQIVDDYSRWAKQGILSGDVEVDWQQLMEHKHSFTGSVSDETRQNLNENGIDTFEGSPSFIDSHTITVDDQRLSAKQIHIATGLIPRPLSLEGAEHVIDNGGFLNMNEMPKRVVFIGGGYISLEFAHVAQRLGAQEVIILEQSDTILPMFDQDIIEVLLEATREAGITIMTSSTVEKVVKDNDEFRVITDDGEYVCDQVVHGAGRVPSTAELNLSAAGVEVNDPGFIKVDDKLQTSQAHITAAGDVASGHPPLSPIAGVEAEIRMAQLRGEDVVRPDYTNVPSVVFTEPRVGKVGLTEDEARERGMSIDIKVTDTSKWFDAKKDFQQYSHAKTITEKDTGKIIGVHVIGKDAEHIVNLYALALEHGMTVQDIRKPIYVFPTSIDDTRYLF